jgi:hypothetical protein
MTDKMISLILNIAIFIIAIVGIILIVNAMGTAPEVDEVTGLDITDTAAVSTSVSFSLGLLYGGGILIAAFTLWAMAMNPKKFIPTAIGLCVFGALVLIAYSMVTIETSGPITKLEGATESSLMWGGLGIQTTYVLVIVAVGLIIMQMGKGIMGYFQK